MENSRSTNTNKMTIGQLIEELKKGDQSKSVFIIVTDEDDQEGPSESVGIAFDDNGDASIYEKAG